MNSFRNRNCSPHLVLATVGGEDPYCIFPYLPFYIVAIYKVIPIGKIIWGRFKSTSCYDMLQTKSMPSHTYMKEPYTESDHWFTKVSIGRLAPALRGLRERSFTSSIFQSFITEDVGD